MCTERLMREVNIPLKRFVGFEKLKRSVVAGLEIKFRALVKLLQPRYLKTLRTSDDNGG